MRLKEQCILGIEATGHSISVGLVNKGVPLSAVFVNSGRPGSETLLAAIEQILTSGGMMRENIEGICITTGPGSFTSMRIGLSVAEALGLGLGIPLYGIDVMTIIASTLPYYPGTIKIILNAYKGEFYTASFNTRTGNPEQLGKLGLISPDLFFDHLQANDLVLGNGLSRVLSRGKADLEEKGVQWNESFQRLPSGIGVAEFFQETTVKKPSDVPLEPIYIRLSDAEINYDKQYGPAK